MLFIYSAPVLIRHPWQHKTVVFLHWCLIHVVHLQQNLANTNEQTVTKGILKMVKYFSCFKSSNMQAFKVLQSSIKTTIPNIATDNKIYQLLNNSSTICGQCYKRFYGRMLRLFIKSQDICPWQGAPLQGRLLASPKNIRLG